MDIYLTKFDIYQGKVASNCLKSTQTLDVLIFSRKRYCQMSGLKFTLSDVTLLHRLKKKLLRPDYSML